MQKVKQEGEGEGGIGELGYKETWTGDTKQRKKYGLLHPSSSYKLSAGIFFNLFLSIKHRKISRFMDITSFKHHPALSLIHRLFLFILNIYVPQVVFCAPQFSSIVCGQGKCDNNKK